MLSCDIFFVRKFNLNPEKTLIVCVLKHLVYVFKPAVRAPVVTESHTKVLNDSIPAPDRAESVIFGFLGKF